MSVKLESAKTWAPLIHLWGSTGWKHLKSGTSRGAEYNLLDFTDPSLPVKCVMRRKLPCSTVNEGGGLRKQSGRTWTHTHSASFSFSAPKWWSICFHFSQLLKFSECMFGERSRVSLCWQASTLCFCYFRFVICDPFSSFHWAQHASVRELVMQLADGHVLILPVMFAKWKCLLCVAEWHQFLGRKDNQSIKSIIGVL